MGIWPFTRSRTDADAEALLTAVQQAARQPVLYGPGRAPDTLQGRFELMAVFGALALIRLKAEPGAEPLAQTFTDKLFRQFDAGLREDGVGDLTVPKRMRRLAGDFYGRLKAYEGPIAAGDAAGLADALVRNTGIDDGFAATLAGAALRTAQAQAGAPVQTMLSADGWFATAG